ncbi:hypothetical protein C7460_10915 [Marinoscillum furvescens DSM 4134]|uniref:Uncharacterized protein n=1 Tax=Marinoscillum furvescens DSM 4134 TaxID=1122208 RepID=A0A3D9L5F3_MARFU|nr:hypothetical protein C7460_10915 [Marinoscillum furvescens DSM 4134]
MLKNSLEKKCAVVDISNDDLWVFSGVFVTLLLFSVFPTGMLRSTPFQTKRSF